MCGEQARYALCQLLIVITMQARTQVQHCNEVSMYSVQHNHKLWAFLSHLWSEVFLQIDVMYCTSKMQYTDVGASSEDRTQDLQLTKQTHYHCAKPAMHLRRISRFWHIVQRLQLDI